MRKDTFKRIKTQKGSHCIKNINLKSSKSLLLHDTASFSVQEAQVWLLRRVLNLVSLPRPKKRSLDLHLMIY